MMSAPAFFATALSKDARHIFARSAAERFTSAVRPPVAPGRRQNGSIQVIHCSRKRHGRIGFECWTRFTRSRLQEVSLSCASAYAGAVERVLQMAPSRID